MLMQSMEYFESVIGCEVLQPITGRPDAKPYMSWRPCSNILGAMLEVEEDYHARADNWRSTGNLSLRNLTRSRQSESNDVYTVTLTALLTNLLLQVYAPLQFEDGR